MDGIVIPFSRGSFWPRDWTRVSCLAGGFFTTEPPEKPNNFKSELNSMNYKTTSTGLKKKKNEVAQSLSRVQFFATPWTVTHQAPLSVGFSRQEYWSGLPFPSPMHESEKWKWNHSVLSDSQRLHGLQPTRLLCLWDFPGKSTGVGCHRLLWWVL